MTPAATDPLVDARGRLCPLPTLMAALRLESMSSGEKLTLRADDPTTRQDFPSWVRERGYVLTDTVEEQDSFRFTVLKP